MLEREHWTFVSQMNGPKNVLWSPFEMLTLKFLLPALRVISTKLARAMMHKTFFALANFCGLCFTAPYNRFLGSRLFFGEIMILFLCKIRLPTMILSPTITELAVKLLRSIRVRAGTMKLPIAAYLRGN